MTKTRYRELANKADASAKDWESLAKRFKASGNIKNAILCARQARRSRIRARYYRDKSNRKG